MLADFLAIPETLPDETLDPRVYVEPKDKLSLPEIVRQAQFLKLMNGIGKRLLIFAVPNAAEGYAKLRQKREGAVYGATDLVIVWTGGVAFIEFKNGTAMPRANQCAFMNRLVEREHHVAVCRTDEGAARWLWGVGAPVAALT